MLCSTASELIEYIHHSPLVLSLIHRHIRRMQQHLSTLVSGQLKICGAPRELGQILLLT